MDSKIFALPHDTIHHFLFIHLSKTFASIHHNGRKTEVVTLISVQQYTV